MDKNLLIDYIKVIFDVENNYIKEKHNYSWILKKNGDKYLIDFPYSNDLKDLYYLVENDLDPKTQFLGILKGVIEKTEEEYTLYKYCGVTGLSFFTLVKLGYPDFALNSLKLREIFSEQLPYIILALLNEEQNFNFNQLGQLQEYYEKNIKTIYENKYFIQIEIDKILSKIIESKYLVVRDVIKSVNLEINKDKEKVKEKIHLLKFNYDFSVLLDELDTFLNSNSSEIVNAGMIGNLRVFMEEIFKEVSKRISSKIKGKIPQIQGRSEMGNIRSYIKDKLELHDNEDKFINNFVNILHSEGGHSFTSEKEYFRLARNIAIEIALLILTKYEKKYALK